MTLGAVFEVIGKFWLQWALGILGGVIVALWRKVTQNHKAQVAKDRAMESALVALMRDRIYQSSKYYLEQGKISSGEMEVLDGLFKSYVDMGGNGVAKAIMDRVRKLEIIVEPIH